MSSPPQTSPTAQQTVRTTTTEQDGIHYSTIYLHTVPGALKIVCMVFTLVGFLLAQFSDFSSTGMPRWFCIFTMIGFWFTAVLLVLYLFHAIYVLNKIPWNKVEFYFCVAIAIILMITSSFTASYGGFLMAAAFCGFVAMCAYGYDAFLKYQLYHTVVVRAVTRTTTISVA